MAYRQPVLDVPAVGNDAVGNMEVCAVNYRNRKFLDLAHGMPCMHCGQGEASEPAHSNWSEHGKGMSIKAHDVYWAALCHTCHAYLDQGGKMTRDERKELWRKAYDATQLWLWQNGKVRVA